MAGFRDGREGRDIRNTNHRLNRMYNQLAYNLEYEKNTELFMHIFLADIVFVTYNLYTFPPYVEKNKSYLSVTVCLCVYLFYLHFVWLLTF